MLLAIGRRLWALGTVIVTSYLPLSASHFLSCFTLQKYDTKPERNNKNGMFLHDL